MMDERGVSYSMDIQGVVSKLHQCTLDAEKSVHRLELCNIRLMLFGYCLADDRVQVEVRPRILPALKPNAPRIGPKSIQLENGAFRRVISDNSLVLPKDFNLGHKKIRLPISVRDIDTEVLHSGAAIYPGCKDSSGRPVIILDCKNDLWRTRNKTLIAKLLSYFYHITKETFRSKGFAALIDARNAKEENFENLVAVIKATEVFFRETLQRIYILFDDTTNSISSQLTDLQLEMETKVILLENVNKVPDLMDKSSLPSEVGGSVTFKYESWILYRQKLESFLRDCYAAVGCFAAVTKEMMQLDDLPKSVRESEMALDHHKEKIKKMLINELLQKLFGNGESQLANIMEAEKQFSKCSEICESVETARELFVDVQNTHLHLEELAEERHWKLIGCLQLRQFEEEASQVINQLCTEGEDMLTNFRTVGENLRSIQLQQIDFEKSYSKFIELVAKGRKIVEDARNLSKLGICDKLTGIENICHELTCSITSFTDRIETMKKTIEDTYFCYRSLDKLCDWSLKTMKFVVDLKLEREMSVMELERSRVVLRDFMEEHPPFPAEEEYHRIEELLHNLNNKKLSEQWLRAKKYSDETHELIRQRHETLLQALRQMKSRTHLQDNLSASDASYRVPCRVSDTPEENANINLAPAVPYQNPCLSSTRLDYIVSHSQPSDFSSTDSRTNVIIPHFDAKNSNESCDVVTSEASIHIKQNEKVLTASHSICNTYPSDSAFSEKCQQITESGLDVAIPPTSSSDLSSYLLVLSQPLVSEALVSCPSLTDFSQPTLSPHLCSQSALSDIIGNGAVTCQPFDIRSYILKDCLPNTSTPVTEVRPWNFSHVTSYDPCELSVQMSSGLPFSSTKSLQCHQYERSNNTEITLRSSSGRVRNVKPIWKSFKKAMSSLADGDLGFGRNLFRKSSHNFSINVMEADSTESLPGMQDEDAPPATTSPSYKEGSAFRKYGWSQIPSNSHLIYSNRLALSVHSQSMMDIRVNEDDARRNRVLLLILQELIMTERDYICSLDYVINDYIPELLDEDIIQPLRGKKNVIFGNIEKIFEFHSHIFLKKVEQCQNSPLQLGACFLEHESDFYLYALYSKNKPKADILMAECGSQYFKKKQRELNDRMDLNSYLLKPIQRMGKYALLLRQVIKECPESHPDIGDLQAALDMVKFQLRHGNDLLAMDCLRDCDVNLREQGMLLRQQEFLVFHGRKKCLRHVFLFEELIILSKTKHTTSGHDVYIYKNSIKTSDLGLTESVGESGCRFEIWFRKRTLSLTYILQAPSPDMKQQWVDDISGLLWKQTFRNRERQQTEMACMGIGSKPSLDIKHSKDNINDRFVDIRLSNRNLAMRPKSISLSSAYDRSRRPHSLISVSSVSSSGSSFSSGYGSCLSSGYGAVGTLTTTEESPLEYTHVTDPEDLSRLGIPQNTSGSVMVLAGADMKDGMVMDVSANANSTSSATEENYVEPSVSSSSKLQVGNQVATSAPKEDAFTQTTLRRPPKHSLLDSIAPIASMESDTDDYF